MGQPFDVGMTGLIGFSSAYHVMMDCDRLLMLGTDFPYRQFFPEAKIAQVDLRPENLGRRARLELGLVGDVGATIDALLPHLTARTDTAHLDRARKNYAKAREGLDDLAKPTKGQPIHPQRLLRVVSEQAAEDAVFTYTVCSPTVWAARYLKMNGRRRMLGLLMHGSMANALSQAIGAQAVDRTRQVISLSGEGGFSMLMGDILTLAQNRLPVKVVITNNGSLGFVSLGMKGAGLMDFGTDLENSDFAALARSIGLHGVRAKNPADLDRAVADVLAHPGPALPCPAGRGDQSERIDHAPVVTATEVKGFSIWGMRAVMNGRGDEVLDLMKGGNILKSLLG